MEKKTEESKQDPIENAGDLSGAAFGSAALLVNLNQECSVKLQKRGIDAYDEYYSRLHMPPPKRLKVGDIYKAPLWDIMKKFGNATYMGPQPPFETVVLIEPLQ